jgi:hypothetical protein
MAGPEVTEVFPDRVRRVVHDLPVRTSRSVVSFDPPRVRYRLRLRLPFRKWSQAVDRDGLREARRWLAQVETRLNGPSPAGEP